VCNISPIVIHIPSIVQVATGCNILGTALAPMCEEHRLIVAAMYLNGTIEALFRWKASRRTACDVSKHARNKFGLPQTLMAMSVMAPVHHVVERS
jgi:hypothetical protein